jgi:predicted metal-dependent phosphoesterase TrpH
MNPCIDLHCHTEFSVDGQGSPEQLVDCAAARGVMVLSITEHNSLGSCRRAAAQALQRGIRYLPGVEIDAVHRGKGYHFLAFGFDPDDARLNALLDDNTGKYRVRFEALFEELEKCGFPLGLECVDDFKRMRYPTHPSPISNIYLLKSFIDDLADPKMSRMFLAAKEALNERRRTDSSLHDATRFCDFEPVRDAVHGAGGVLLLAHVGNYLPGDSSAQTRLIRTLIANGLDGFELYHWKNRDDFPYHKQAPVFENLSRLGEELGCLLSGGSDCHNASSTTLPIGGCGAPIEIIQPLLDACRHKPGHPLQECWSQG